MSECSFQKWLEAVDRTVKAEDLVDMIMDIFRDDDDLMIMVGKDGTALLASWDMEAEKPGAESIKIPMFNEDRGRS